MQHVAPLLCKRPMLFIWLCIDYALQEIQESSTADAPAAVQQPHPGQVLRLFWDRQAAQAAAAAAGSDTTFATGTTSATAATLSSEPMSTATAGGLLGASSAMRTGSGAAAAAAAATAAAATLGQQQQQLAAAAGALSRYRSDFQELNRLGQGGFGVVVAAVNRCGLCVLGRTFIHV